MELVASAWVLCASLILTADDIAIFDDSESQICSSLELFPDEAEKLGLNWDKTELLATD